MFFYIFDERKTYKLKRLTAKNSIHIIVIIGSVSIMHLNAKDCESYYCAQVGGGAFVGNPHQRGYGIFRDLSRFITPIALRAGRYLGRRLLDTGRNVLTDVASGSSLKHSARNRIHETSKKIKDDIFQKLQQGQGIKRKRKKESKQSKAKRRKVVQNDIFHS